MIVIVDIDNTLALNKKRFKECTDENGKIDWESVYEYERVLSDTPNTPMIDLTKRYFKSGYKVVIFTGRPDSTKDVTEKWLEDNGVMYHELHMRTKDDHYIKADILKKKMYNMFIDDMVLCAYDDEQDIIDLWVNLGIPSFKVYIP